MGGTPTLRELVELLASDDDTPTVLRIEVGVIKIALVVPKALTSTADELVKAPDGPLILVLEEVVWSADVPLSAPEDLMVDMMVLA